MGLKKVDGTVENIVKNSTRIFKHGKGLGKARFLIKRSILLERKEELAPSGTLTVTCTIGHYEEMGPISRTLRLSDDLESMFISQRGCDTILKVQNEEFHVNKSILMSRSPDMFEVEMEEKDTGVVHIKDCTPEAFKDFLKYIYSGKFTSSFNHAFQLYRIAEKYDIEELMSDCIACIMTNLSIDNVLDAAVIGFEGYTFDANELQSKTQHLFNKNYAEIMLSSKWSSFLRENLSVCEKLMKNMANKVVKNKSKKRKLDDL